MRSAQVVLNAIDGRHLWGSFDAVVGSYGRGRYRLVVYPPGISAGERRVLRLWRGWPIGGGLAALLAIMVLGDGISSMIVAAAFVGGGMWLFAVSATTRGRVRTMLLVSPLENPDSAQQRRIDEWAALVESLTSADRLLKAGVISCAEHESLWWQVYDRLDLSARA